MRRLGVDPGSVRTGVALCETDMHVATPLRTVPHRSQKEAVVAVAQIVREVDALEIVVGLPLRMDGSEGEAARRARRFAKGLQDMVALPVILWDERLTTVAADRALTAQGVRGTARREVVDQAAATLLLQSYLDAQEHRPWEPTQSHSLFEAPLGEKVRRKRHRRHKPDLDDG